MLQPKVLIAAAILILCGQFAHATNRLTCSNSSNVPDTSLNGFNFDIEVAYSGTSGSGASTGKPTTSLTVVFPLSSQYAAISHLALDGLHSSSCVLSESPNSSVSVEVAMKDVVFTSLKLVKGADFDVLAANSMMVQLTLAYSSYTLSVN